MKKKIFLLFTLLAAFFFLITYPTDENSSSFVELKEAEGATIAANTYVYFELPSGWSSACFMVGHGSYSRGYQMTKITNTDIYYVKMAKWDGYTEYAFFNVNNWGAENSSVSHRKQYATAGATNVLTTNFYEIKDSYNLFSDNAKNANPGSNQYGTSYSGLNVTVNVSGTTGGSVSASGMKLNSATTATSASGTSINVIKHTPVTLTATPSSGYTFAGWYSDAQCTKLISTSATYKVDNATADTYYAGWKKTHEIYFATNNSNWGDKANINACLNLTGNQWENISMTYDSSQTYRGYRVYKVSMPIIYDSNGNAKGIDILEFYNGSGLKCFATGNISDGVYTKKNIGISVFSGKLYFDDAYDKDGGITGWKSKVTTTFHKSGGKNSSDSVEPEVITKYSGDILTPETIYKDGYVFAGWYDNEALEGKSVSEIVASSSTTNYYVLWGRAFSCGETIYCIPSSDWLASGSIGVYLYDAEHLYSTMYNMDKVTNPDGSIIYKFVIPDKVGDGSSVFINAIFVWGNANFINNPSWDYRKAQTNDLTRDDVGVGYEVNNDKTTIDGTLIYHGDWVDMSIVTIANRNGSGGSIELVHKSGYEIGKLTYSAPINKSFNGFILNGVNIELPLVVPDDDITYTEHWVDVDSIDPKLVLYYRETSLNDNSYGVVPFIAGMGVDLDANFSHYNIGTVSYKLTIKKDGVNISSSAHSTIDAMKEALASFGFENSCLLNTGTIDNSTFNNIYSFELVVYETSNSSNIILNNTVNSTIATLVDEYILNRGASLDITTNIEDKAVYQLHEHSIAPALLSMYMNDNNDLYEYCSVCMHELILEEDVELEYTELDDEGYLFTYKDKMYVAKKQDNYNVQLSLYDTLVLGVESIYVTDSINVDSSEIRVHVVSNQCDNWVVVQDLGSLNHIVQNTEEDPRKNKRI